MPARNVAMDASKPWVWVWSCVSDGDWSERNVLVDARAVVKHAHEHICAANAELVTRHKDTLTSASHATHEV